MPKIIEEVYYNGARDRAERLGLGTLIDEIRTAVQGFTLLVKEETDANGGAAVRKLLDGQFRAAGGWQRKVVGDIDWIKCHQVNGTRVCVGVEVQVSARSDLLAVDMIHLAAAFRDARIDIGVLVTSSDRLSRFLTDRGPSISDAKRHVKSTRLEDYPLILLAVEHDGPGEPLAKQPKRARKPPRPDRGSSV